MADAYQALAEKDKVIQALSRALDQAYDALEELQFADDMEEVSILAEATCDEITEALISAGISKDLIPGATL